MIKEKTVRNRKIYLEKLGYDISWITDKTQAGKEFERKIKKLLSRKPTGNPKTYEQLCYPKEIGGYGLSISYLQKIVNRERRRYGV